MCVSVVHECVIVVNQCRCRAALSFVHQGKDGCGVSGRGRAQAGGTSDSAARLLDDACALVFTCCLIRFGRHKTVVSVVFVMYAALACSIRCTPVVVSRTVGTASHGVPAVGFRVRYKNKITQTKSKIKYWRRFTSEKRQFVITIFSCFMWRQ